MDDKFTQRAKQYQQLRDCPYEVMRIDLSTARANEMLQRAGDMLLVLDASSDNALLSIKINSDNPNSPLLPLKRYNQIETFYTVLYLTNTAQAGEWIDIIIAIKEYFYVKKFFTDKVRNSLTHTFINNITLDDDPTLYLSDALDVSIYKKGLLEINLAVVATPADILFELFFSDDNVTYYKYMRDFWGDLRYVTGGGAKLECFDFPVLSNYIKVKATATGTTAANKFIVTATGTLSR